MVDLSNSYVSSPEGISHEIPLNPIKPPFSYGFPMVFLWIPKLVDGFRIGTPLNFLPSWCGAEGRFGPSTLAYTDHNNGTVTVAVGTHLAGKHPLQITLWAAQMSLFRKPFWDILRIFCDFFRSPELFNLRAWLMAVGDSFGDFLYCALRGPASRFPTHPHRRLMFAPQIVLKNGGTSSSKPFLDRFCRVGKLVILRIDWLGSQHFGACCRNSGFYSHVFEGQGSLPFPFCRGIVNVIFGHSTFWLDTFLAMGAQNWHTPNILQHGFRTSLSQIPTWSQSFSNSTISDQD